jgi:hypothetical protein
MPIEVILRAGMLEALSGIPVYMEKPADISGTYVILEKTGGDIYNHIMHATIAVQTYAPTMYGAAQLANQARDAFFSLLENDHIFSIELNSGPYNFTDHSTKQYRYQSVFVITYEEE